MKYLIRPSAEKQFAKLDIDTRLTILKKLRFFISSPDPLVFAKRLKHFEGGQYRFRIGQYRIVFDVREDTILVLSVGHRREIYK